MTGASPGETVFHAFLTLCTNGPSISTDCLGTGVGIQTMWYLRWGLRHEVGVEWLNEEESNIYPFLFWPLSHGVKCSPLKTSLGPSSKLGQWVAVSHLPSISVGPFLLLGSFFFPCCTQCSQPTSPWAGRETKAHPGSSSGTQTLLSHHMAPSTVHHGHIPFSVIPRFTFLSLPSRSSPNPLKFGLCHLDLVWNFRGLQAQCYWSSKCQGRGCEQSHAERGMGS